jgi:hypothetical protein
VFETGASFNHPGPGDAYTPPVVTPFLTFFVELDSDALTALFARPEVVPFLARGGHAVSLGMLDLTPARAAVVRQLEAAGIPVCAWLLLDPAHGYWLTADNAPEAALRYREVHAFAEEHGLGFARIGLDIEAPRAHLDQVLRDPMNAMLDRLRLRRSRAAIAAAEAHYRALVAEIHGHGRLVESYQFPLVLDERAAQSTLMRRVVGLVEVECDAEVLMVYRSYFGQALVHSYCADASRIALGVTGGGVHADEPEIEPRIGFAELESDLLAASRHSRELYVFSLEGCVQNGMLDAIAAIDWSREPERPSKGAMRRARRKRRLVQTFCGWEQALDRLLPEGSSNWVARLWDLARDRSAARRQSLPPPRPGA